MRSKILLIGVVLFIFVISSYFLLWPRISLQPTEELKLSDFPKVFKENPVIVIGENASQIEKESAEEIAANLEKLIGNKPEIISSKNIESFKYPYNLIILGTPKTNPLLEEIYRMTNVTRVTEECPGKGKGILEILKNPWNEDKAMLLVEGSNEWGVKGGSEMLVEKRVSRLPRTMMTVEFKPLTEREMKKVVEDKAKEIYKTSKVKAYRIYNSPLYKVTPDVYLFTVTVTLPDIPPDLNVPFRKIFAFNVYYENIFILPEEFNKLIERADIIVKDEKTAIDIVTSYFWALYYEEGGKWIILEDVKEIPQEKLPESAKNPSLYKDIVKPLSVLNLEGKGYYIEFYTWYSINGVLEKWGIEIGEKGSLKVKERKVIDDLIGQFGKKLPY